MEKTSKKYPSKTSQNNTEEQIQNLKEAFKVGCTEAEALLSSDVSEEDYTMLIEENSYLSGLFEQLKLNPIVEARKTLYNALVKDPKIAFDYLKHKLPNEFKAKVESDENAQRQMSLTPEQVENIIHHLKSST